MSDENFPPASARSAGSATDPAAADVDAPASEVSGEESPTGEERAAQYGVGPFTIREVSLLGVWLIAFLVSFFSVWVEAPVSSVLLPSGSVWSTGIDWVLTIGVPTVAVFLVVLRRFSPDGIRRVGSLAVDQFASVAFSVSAVVWLGVLWTNISRGIQTGLWLNSWVVWVEFFLMVAGVFLTVLAPFIQPFDEDFAGRPQTAAHRNARPVRPVVARPAAPRAAADRSAETFAPVPAAEAAPVAADSEPARDEPGLDETAAFPFAAEEDPTEQAPVTATQAFWALSPVERDVVDENGLPLFTVGPTAWALVIEDRGDRFVVRHEDGRVGYLTDISGVTRG
ncbi:hypothetical protein [Microbacterium sp. T2.11-28]|uniref:hypothetical protein n=1 Tax=Microbacterium sp. T2.11-28 TaxID=3041169 RepID=UPI0024778490|nr:hypothetical protein [Microbacterium sp. T2.11-28]CAI9392208.1 hypothetical protein MICABA_02035 [Microbacterium sp. T2.11-28]